MTFYKKYLKYKKKYIDLVGGNPYLNQIVEELKEDKDYENINLILGNPIILNLNYKNNCFTIIFENEFPKFIPKVYIDDILIEIPSLITDYWNVPLDDNLIDYLIKIIIMERLPRILIFCHPKKVTGTCEYIEGHWWSGKISEISKELKLSGELIIETLDVLKGGTYEIDGFSDKFINDHLEEYNMVLIPDCSDKWAFLQNETLGDININLSRLMNEYIIKTLRLVKLGGAIIFSKLYDRKNCIINGIQFNDFFDAIIHFLNIHGFKTEKRYYDFYQIYFIIGFRTK
jgi:hypothetical protein